MYFNGDLASDNVARVLVFFLKKFRIFGIFDFPSFPSVSFGFVVFQAGRPGSQPAGIKYERLYLSSFLLITRPETLLNL